MIAGKIPDAVYQEPCYMRDNHGFKEGFFDTPDYTITAEDIGENHNIINGIIIEFGALNIKKK